MPLRLRFPLAALRWSSLAAVFLALAALAGCSNNPYPLGETASPVIYRQLVAELRTLDPTKSYTVDEAYVVDLIYPGYYRYHYLRQEPFELELNLGAEEAKREPYAFPDPKTGKTVQGESWTFKIKPGMRFQDDKCFGPTEKGREIVPADFLFSFKRMADPAIACPILGFLQDKIIGLQEYADECRKRKDRGLEPDLQASVPGLQLDEKDPHTFRILLNQPYPQLRYLMAMHFTTPLAHEAVKTYGKLLRDHPVGCGPYKLKEYTKKQQIVLTVNPNRVPEYYPTQGGPGDEEAGLLVDAGKQLPLADTVIFKFIPERITAWNLYLQGYLDRFSVTQDNFRQVMAQMGGLSDEMKRKGVVLSKVATPNTYYFGFNMTDETFGGITPARRKLRQAIALAIKPQEFIDLLFAGNGTAPEWLLPPGIVGYDPKFKNPYQRGDLDRAKQLLAEAGYAEGIGPDGKRLTLTYDNRDDTPEDRQFTGLLTRQVEALGLKLESRTSRDVIWQDRVDKGDFQFVAYGWFADYPDPENFLFLLYGPNRRPGPNHTAYLNPDYDKLFEQVRAMDDGPERLAIIEKLRAIAVEDCPWIPYMHRAQLGLDYDWLKNGKSHGMANDLSKYWRVDGARRAERQAAWNKPNYLPAIGLVLGVTLASLPAAAVIRRRRRRKVRRETGDEL